MKSATLLFLSAFLLSSIALPLAVQAAAVEEPSDAPDSAEAQAADTPVDEDQTAEEMLAAEAALEAEQAKNDPAAASAPAAEANEPELVRTSPDSNEDFVPTIQISEDLSVSFPVDI